MIVIVALFAAWSFFSSQADTLSKRILVDLPYPLTLTIAQFAVSAVLGFVFLRVIRVADPDEARTTRPSLWKLPGIPLLLVCVAQALGFFLTNLASLRGAVSFVQALKVRCEL
jgi:hypothetical protein